MKPRNPKRHTAVRPRRPAGPRTLLRRRPSQQRGEIRLEALLDAAEQVIAKVGVDAATTNAIAARAGAGMGSLYHFFPNKEAIVAALAERYMARIRPLTLFMERPGMPQMTVARLVDEIVDPLAEFYRRAPAYRHVYHATNKPGMPSSCRTELQETVVAHVDGLMAARAPHLEPAQRRVHAMVAVELVHRMLDMAFEAPAAQRPALLTEVKRLLALYSVMVQSGDDPLRRLA